MRTALASVLLLTALACAGGTPEVAPEAPPAAVAPVAAPAPATPGASTPPITVTVVLDAAAEAELVRRGEGITVSFFISDVPTDDGTTRSAEASLGSSGGKVVLPPVSMAPGALGQPVNNWTVNVFTARKTDENNLIGCDAPGDVGTPPTEVVVKCSLL